jgi:hypothetical protein
MENYYLSGILKLEIDASNHSQKLILEDMVTLEGMCTNIFTV